MDNVDYIISYRESTPDRKRALHFVANWLHRAFPRMNIVVVEQDSRPRLDIGELPFCRRLFIPNPGLFNRGWSNNVGAAATANPYLVFADVDVFMAASDYSRCFYYLQDFEAVDPKKYYLWNVGDVTPDGLHYRRKSLRYGNTFAGGIFLIRRDSFLSLGMWDEEFEGWGGEDNVMEHVIRAYLKHCRLQLDVFHIDHRRTAFDGRRQPRYLSNSKRSRHICSLHGEPLLRYVEDKKKRSRGCRNKYVLFESSFQ